MPALLPQNLCVQASLPRPGLFPRQGVVAEEVCVQREAEASLFSQVVPGVLILVTQSLPAFVIQLTGGQMGIACMLGGMGRKEPGQRSCALAAQVGCACQPQVLEEVC